MAEPTFNDPSWDAGWLSLNGWIYPSSWADSDTQLKNAISTTYRRARTLVGRLGPQTGEMKRLVEDWKQMLEDWARPIQYREAEWMLEDLNYIVEEATQQLETDRLLVESKQKPGAVDAPPSIPPPVTSVAPSKKPKKPVKPGGMSDDEAFANVMLGFSKSTAKKPPPKVTPVSRPYVPPTPAQVWVTRQRQMATDCDNGIRFGEHAVNQESVLRQLSLGSSDGSVWQYRCGPENSHVRIMKSNVDQYWTKGLTHDDQRRNGKFMVYRRNGSSSKFTHVSGQRHPEEDLG